jgi:hypothetical protein
MLYERVVLSHLGIRSRIAPLSNHFFTTWLRFRILLLMYWSCQNLLNDMDFTIIDMNFHLSYDRFMKLLHAFSYDIWRVLSSLLSTKCHMIWFLRLWYPNSTMDDTLIPPPLSVLRCEHGLEAHVKQSRHPSTTARAYYCCRYMVVSI